MDWHSGWQVFFLFCNVLSLLAAFYTYGKDFLAWFKARSRGAKAKFRPSRPWLLYSLITCAILSGVGCAWIALHPVARQMPAPPPKVSTNPTPGPQPPPNTAPLPVPNPPKRTKAKPVTPVQPALVQPNPAQPTIDASGSQFDAHNCGAINLGSNNTNTLNCAPQDRHVTDPQKIGLEKLAELIPRECMVVFGSDDTGEPEAFAKEIHDAYAEHGTT